MIPILIVARDQKKAQQYITSFAKEHQFKSAYTYTYFKDGTVLRIDQIRELRGLFNRASKEKKLVVMYDYETAKAETQNALLKTLEDDSQKAQFILICRDATDVLPTILSRCRIIKLSSMSTASSEGILHKSFKDLLGMYSGLEKKKDTAVALVDNILHELKDELVMKKEITPERRIKLALAVKEILVTRNTIMKNNVNPQSAIDHILLFLNNNNILLTSPND